MNVVANRSSMSLLTREEALAILGDIDETLIAEIVATGASRADLVRALDRLRCVEIGLPAPEADSPRVATLCELLAAWWDGPEESESQVLN